MTKKQNNIILRFFHVKYAGINQSVLYMKIAILGGGITGLTSAYYLAKDGHRVTIMEKESALGGLASGFKSKDWNWYLERAYHHLFASDHDILNFAKEIDFDKIYFRSPETSSLFNNETMKQSNNFSVYPLDTPLDLLKFPLLGLIDKLRAGLIIIFLKLSPFLPMYKKMTSEEFLKKAWGLKFGIHYGNSSFGESSANMRELFQVLLSGPESKRELKVWVILREDFKHLLITLKTS